MFWPVLGAELLVFVLHHHTFKLSFWQYLLQKLMNVFILASKRNYSRRNMYISYCPLKGAFTLIQLKKEKICIILWQNKKKERKFPVILSNTVYICAINFHHSCRSVFFLHQHNKGYFSNKNH